jgi:four helix bundle protein
MKDYREMKIWQRSHAFTISVYRATKGFPRDELFALTSQMRRACTSIPANIAEGCGRDGDAELKRYLTIALGSAYELDYYLLLARELSYLDEPAGQPLAAKIMEIGRMLGSFIQ